MNNNLPPPDLPVEQPPQRCGLALASLILGIAGMVLCLGPLAGIPAVICGHIAQSKIRKSGGTLSGGGLAVGGLVTGYIATTLVLIIGLLAAVAIPNFLKARATSHETACVANLKVIEGAKDIWALENKKQTTDTPTDSDLFGPDKSIREKPICPDNGTYTLNDVGTKPTCSVHSRFY